MFDLLMIPRRSRGTRRTNGPLEYGRRQQYDFFVCLLQGVSTTDWNRTLEATAASSV
jgi:hypothetical protein